MQTLLGELGQGGREGEKEKEKKREKLARQFVLAKPKARESIKLMKVRLKDKIQTCNTLAERKTKVRLQ